MSYPYGIAKRPKYSQGYGDGSAATPTSNEIYLAQKLAGTYAIVLKSDRIMRDVIDALGLDISPSRLRSCVSLSSVEDTQVLFLTVAYPEPQMAIDIANALIDVAPQVMMETVEIGSVNVLDSATISTPASISLTKNAALGGAIGLMLGVGVALLAGLLFPKVKNSDDVKDVLTIPTLGEIAHLGKRETNGLLLANPAAPSHLLDAFLVLSASVRYVAQARGMKKLLITSALEGEGKTFVSINLAGALAQSGKRVLLIDCDLRGQSLGKRLGIARGQAGDIYHAISDPAGGADLSKCIVELRPGLSVIPFVGARGAKDIAFINARPFAGVLGTLAQDYDYVIIDSTPAYLIAETMDLVGLCDGVLFVIKQEHAPEKILLETAERLVGVGAKIIGCVLNDIRHRHAGSGYVRQYRYGYSNARGEPDQR